MAIQHKVLPLMAVQFHPESVLTKDGMQMMRNWINSI
jgi:anthranilate/para-aminobenzoate synthase component II